MNPIAKCYCRLYQLAFRLAMPLMPYREPERFDSINSLPPLFGRLNVRSVLLVTDEPLRQAGVTAALEALFKQSGIRCAVYDRTRANPTVQNVEEARALYLSENCQALIAFGGGSSIDCAKAVGARIVRPRRSLYQMKGLLRVLRPLPPLVAIPTTAGTGSEATVTAVITDTEKKHKYTMNNFTMIPRYTVLDPAVTRSLPPALTASTGMDALTHAVEAYIGGSTTARTRRLARKAVRLIFENLETAYRCGDDMKARKNMLYAAHIAGIAFTRSYVGYIHAVAHSLGGQYNTPHGLANAVLLPIGLERYGSCIYGKLRELAKSAGIAGAGATKEEGAAAFIAAVRRLNERLGIPERLPEIRPEDVPVMAAHAAREANPLYPVPRLMDARELREFYQKAADGR